MQVPSEMEGASQPLLSCKEALRTLSNDFAILHMRRSSSPQESAAEVAALLAQAEGHLGQALGGGWDPEDVDTSIYFALGGEHPPVQVPARFAVLVLHLWSVASPALAARHYVQLCALVWLAREAHVLLRLGPSPNRLVMRGLLAAGAVVPDLGAFRKVWGVCCGPTYFHNPDLRVLTLDGKAWGELAGHMGCHPDLHQVVCALEVALLCPRAPPQHFCEAARQAIWTARGPQPAAALEAALSLARRGLFLELEQRSNGGTAPPAGCDATAHAVAATREGRLFLMAAGLPINWAGRPPLHVRGGPSPPARGLALDNLSVAVGRRLG